MNRIKGTFLLLAALLLCGCQVKKLPEKAVYDTGITADSLKSIAAALAQHDIAEGGVTFDERVNEFCGEYCRAALLAVGGKKKAAYEQLGLSHHTFSRYISQP